MFHALKQKSCAFFSCEYLLDFFSNWDHLLDLEEHLSAGLACVPTTSESFLPCTFLCWCLPMNCCFSCGMIADFFGAGKEIIRNFQYIFCKKKYWIFPSAPVPFRGFFHSSETHQHARKLCTNNETWAHGVCIFSFPCGLKFFCLIREQHTDAWNIVHKIFSTSSKKKTCENIRPLRFGLMLFTRGMYELWLTWRGLIHDCWKHGPHAGRAPSFLSAATCPWNLVDCWTYCTIPI